MTMQIPTEEQQTTEAPLEGAEPTRAELLAAAVEAGVPDVPEESAEGAPAGVATSTDEEPKLTRLLREREKGMQEREASRNHAEEIRADAARERDRIIAEAKEQARQEYAAEQAALRERARLDPMGTIQALGGGDDIADAIIKSTTPEGKELLKMRAELAEAKKIAATGGAVKQEWDAWKAQEAKKAEQASIAEAQQRFMTVATKEAAPYLHARYEPAEILARANAKAIELRNSGMQLGKDFDFPDLVQYLETESRTRLGGLGTGLAPAQQVRAEAVSTPPGSAPKVTANGSRTPAMAGGERRATPKPLAEMTPAQQRQALIEEAEAAMRAAGTSK